MNDARTLSVLTVLLRGQNLCSIEWSGFSEPGLFIGAAEHHGVLPLAAERLTALSAAPLLLRERARAAANRAVGADLVRERELRRLVSAFAAASVQVLVFKGAQLAYSVYKRPDLRPRLDTDVLIAPAARGATEDVLTALGYVGQLQAGSEFVVHQRTFTKTYEGGLLHAVDVHWRPSNPEIFGTFLNFEEAWDESVAIPALGPSARGLSEVHALFVACVHRVAHHFDQTRLIWLVDIDLLARTLDYAAWQRFSDLARERGMTAVCQTSLKRASQMLGSPVPAWLLTAVSTEERSASYLNGRRPHIAVVLEDLQALPTWSARLSLMREHVFPSAEYMRRVYAPTSRMPLIWLYGRRVIVGARRWIV